MGIKKIIGGSLMGVAMWNILYFGSQDCKMINDLAKRYNYQHQIQKMPITEPQRLVLNNNLEFSVRYDSTDNFPYKMKVEERK